VQVIEYTTLLVFAVPLVILLINILLPRQLAEKSSIGLAYLAPLVQIVATAAGLVQIAQLKQHEFAISWNLAGAVSVRFAVNVFSLVLLFCIGMVTLAAIMVANRTVPQKRAGFAGLLMMLIVGMNGMVLVTDLFSLYVFLEIVGISSFVLIAMFKSDTGLEGAFKYLVMSVLASIMILTGLAFVFMQTGSLQYDQVGAAGGALVGPGAPHLALMYTAMALMIAGFAIKTGAVPFHSWLPDAHQSANTAVSVLLSGIVIKIAGIYGFIVITNFFGRLPGIDLTLALIGTVSIVVGALFALRQSHFKRIVAYSSVSQMGYILLGLSTGSVLGLLGAVAHVFNHATFKSTLFTNAAAVHEQTGTYDINELGGLEKKMPVTSFSSLAAFMSTAGIPPFAGFWSKLLIIMALWNSGDWVFAAIALIASIFTAAYFLRLQRKVFFGKLLDKFAQLTEIGGSVKWAQIMLTVVTIAAGLLFPFALRYFGGIGIL